MIPRSGRQRLLDDAIGSTRSGLEAVIGSFKLKLVFWFALLALVPLGIAFYGYDALAKRSETRRTDGGLESALRGALAGYVIRLDAASSRGAATGSRPAAATCAPRPRSGDAAAARRARRRRCGLRRQGVDRRDRPPAGVRTVTVVGGEPGPRPRLGPRPDRRGSCCARSVPAWRRATSSSPSAGGIVAGRAPAAARLALRSGRRRARPGRRYDVPRPRNRAALGPAGALVRRACAAAHARRRCPGLRAGCSARRCSARSSCSGSITYLLGRSVVGTLAPVRRRSSFDRRWATRRACRGSRARRVRAAGARVQRHGFPARAATARRPDRAGAGPRRHAAPRRSAGLDPRLTAAPAGHRRVGRRGDRCDRRDRDRPRRRGRAGGRAGRGRASGSRSRFAPARPTSVIS